MSAIILVNITDSVYPINLPNLQGEKRVLREQLIVLILRIFSLPLIIFSPWPFLPKGCCHQLHLSICSYHLCQHDNSVNPINPPNLQG